ncbi:hypothetical protein Btru_051797 [Bulinus truncatus]|nr:hypothetical protein Btru_051797 [Bulinus truncatus]
MRTKDITRIKSAYSLGNSKDSTTQATQVTSASTTTSNVSTGSKKKNIAMASRQISTNLQSNKPVQSSKSAGSKLWNSQESISGESMPAQKTSVPVMMDYTLSANGQTSNVHGGQKLSEPLPVKSAAKTAMENAVVDKGDVTSFKESRHPGGKVEKTFKTGTKEIYFPNGTIKEISTDGQTIICRLAKGDVRETFPDHRVVYIFAEAEILQTTFPDGLETYEFKNGQTVKRYPDGTVEIIFPSKDVIYIFPNGGQEVILTNGTVMQYNSKSERTVEYPSGDREILTAEYQRREFPDGIIKTIYADGRHETRFPNGRVRLRDKSGNVIMDQIVYR